MYRCNASLHRYSVSLQWCRVFPVAVKGVRAGRKGALHHCSGCRNAIIALVEGSLLLGSSAGAYTNRFSAASSRGNAASISGIPTAPTLSRNHPVSSTEPKAWKGTTAMPAASST